MNHPLLNHSSISGRERVRNGDESPPPPGIDVRGLLDRIGILDTLARFNLAIDWEDWSTARDCFAPDVDYDESELHGLALPREAEALIEELRIDRGGLQARQHVETGHLIRLKGASATCRCNFIRRHMLPNDRGSASWIVGGRCDYRLRRDSVGWRICGCRIALSWSEGNPQVVELARCAMRSARAG